MIRMGLIGAGTMGAMYARAYSQCKSSELVAICDINEKKVKSLARKFGVPRTYADYNEMLREEELDAVTVATPDFLHREPSIAAIRAGRDVLCEKPLAVTLRDCAAIRDAVRKHGVKFMTNFGNRHKSKVYTIKQQIERGALGKIENVFIQLREPINKTRTLAWAEKTNPTFFLLSHCLDTVMYLLGSRPVEVYARATRGVLSSQGLDTTDTVIAVMQFENGAVVNMDANWIMPEGFAPRIDFSLEIIGRKAAIYCKLRSDDLVLHGKKATALDYGLDAVDPLGVVHGWWYESVYYFIECLERDIQPSPTVEEGLEVTRALLAVEKSCRTGRPVKV